jgi:hypothetical protein
MKTSLILTLAKSFIDSPKTWTQFEEARDANDRYTSPRNDDAVCFCSLGALRRTGIPGGYEYRHALNFLTLGARSTSGLIYDTIHEFNDRSTHEEVMAVWDRAIKHAESLGE